MCCTSISTLPTFECSIFASPHQSMVDYTGFFMTYVILSICRIFSSYRRFSAIVFYVTFCSKTSYAYGWKGVQLFYLLVKVSFVYFSPVNFKSLCFSVLSTKDNFVQRHSVLSYLHPITSNGLCHVTG